MWTYPVTVNEISQTCHLWLRRCGSNSPCCHRSDSLTMILLHKVAKRPFRSVSRPPPRFMLAFYASEERSVLELSPEYATSHPEPHLHTRPPPTLHAPPQRMLSGWEPASFEEKEVKALNITHQLKDISGHPDVQQGHAAQSNCPWVTGNKSCLHPKKIQPNHRLRLTASSCVTCTWCQRRGSTRHWFPSILKDTRRLFVQLLIFRLTQQLFQTK